MLNYGIIGNCRTCALVGSEGSIDWFCFPRFDSPSAFAKIIDKKKGGQFGITPAGDYKITQKYIENTNVLETSFKGEKSAFRIIDFFPCYLEGGELKKIEQLHRLLVVDKGTPVLRISYKPKLDYARGATKVRVTKDEITAANGKQKLYLYSNLDLKALGKKYVSLTGNSFFVLSWSRAKSPQSITYVEEEKEKTVKYWRGYISDSTVPNFHRNAVIRSILALKLLTFHDSGGVVASATASIPEVIGGERNWDKRYCWLKDQSFAIDALTNVRLFDEVKGFMKFLASIGTAYVMKDNQRGFGMQSIYRPHGELSLKEQSLEHMAGYRDSRPVRIGNDAYRQRNVGVFGEVLDAIYKFFVTHGYAERMMESQFMVVKRMVEYVAKHWREKDGGAWEFREIKEHFTSSRLLAWVAMDRGIKLSREFDPSSSVEKWERIRDEIREDILKNYDEKTGAFTLFHNSEDLDASLLLMSYYGFLEPDDPKFVSTVNAIERKLKVGPFLRPFSGRRKIETGLGRPKSAVISCTLWLIDALFAVGEEVKAKILLEKVLRYSNHLGLFSESIDLMNHEPAGNIPHAQTHIAFISTVVKLSGEEPGSGPSQARFIE
ncbi:MAG: glycoside hydrolase family 15 protein [Candidatus Hydrothermarchaeaceae archaeon]